MPASALAIAIFVLTLAGIATFFVVFGRLSFWKLVHRIPYSASEFFRHSPVWLVQEKGEASPKEGYIGPFLFVDPELGRSVRLFALEAELEKSQKQFMEENRDEVPRYTFPWISALSLLYPISAMKSMGSESGSTVQILGYGVANLGYLMMAAAIITGSFRILGLEYRIQTLIGALVAIVAGLLITNV